MGDARGAPAERGGRCPICAGPAIHRLCWRSPYRIHECGSCGLLFAAPLPSADELARFYQGFLYKRPDSAELGRRVGARRTEIHRLFGSSSGRQRRFLDHGGGVGLACRAAGELGFDAYLYELDTKSVAFAKGVLGLDATRCLSDLESVRGSFDCILSDNVIEHVPDPVGLLQQLVSLLKPGGLLVVKTPHAKSRELLFYPVTLMGYLQRAVASNGLFGAAAALWRAPVWFCDPPRHLYSFTACSMARAAERAGLQDCDCTTRFYRRPLLDNSSLRAIARRPKSVRSAIRWAPTLVLAWFELPIKSLQWSLWVAGKPIPSGLILEVQKGAAA